MVLNYNSAPVSLFLFTLKLQFDYKLLNFDKKTGKVYKSVEIYYILRKQLYHAAYKR